MYKKIKKRIPTRNNFVFVFASKFKGISPHATWGTTGADVCISSVMCCATYKEELRDAGSTFDGGWGTRWWQDLGGGKENERWAVGVEVHGHVAVDRSRSGMTATGLEPTTT